MLNNKEMNILQEKINKIGPKAYTKIEIDKLIKESKLEANGGK